jgi:hypothetical protein
MVGGWPDQGGVTCAAAAVGNLRHRPSSRSDWTPLCSIWRGDVEGLRHTRLFQTIQCPCARKLERARAVDAISARDFGQFPSEVSVTIQTAEFDPRNSEFRFPGCNYDIQTAPYWNWRVLSLFLQDVLYYSYTYSRVFPETKETITRRANPKPFPVVLPPPHPEPRSKPNPGGRCSDGGGDGSRGGGLRPRRRRPHGRGRHHGALAGPRSPPPIHHRRGRRRRRRRPP